MIRIKKYLNKDVVVSEGMTFISTTDAYEKIQSYKKKIV